MLPTLRAPMAILSYQQHNKIEDKLQIIDYSIIPKENDKTR
jgi:hypothetical protein